MNHILCHPLLEKRLAELGDKAELPALPEVYFRLQKALKDDKTTVNDIARIIEGDAGLVIRILKTVNSAAYGPKNPVVSISQAIGLLGFNEIANLTLATTVAKQIIPEEKGKRTLDLHRFWEHSLAVAIASRILAKYSSVISQETKEECFIGGLIHDFGKLIEYQFFNDEFNNALSLCRKEGITTQMAEQKVFGFNHQDVGAHLADSWGLSRNLVKMVELHNVPEDLDESDPSFELVSVVHVANTLAHFLQMGYAGDPFIPPFHSPCFGILDIPTNQIQMICDELVSTFVELIQIFHEAIADIPKN